MTVSLERRPIQRLYLEVLTEPREEDIPLDFDTIVGRVFPVQKQRPVPIRLRKRVRRWIDELVDRGILVQSWSDGDGKREVLEVNPSRPLSLDEIDKQLGVPDELTFKGKVLAYVMAAVCTLFLSLFAAFFMPRDLLTQIATSVGFISLVLGLFGLRLRGAMSVEEVIWSRKTARGLGLFTILFTLATFLGWLLPFQVTAIPGATVLVDGRVHSVVPATNGRSAAPVTFSLYLPWGTHKIAVEKRWYEDANSRESSSSDDVSWPFDCKAETHLIARLSLVTRGYSRTTRVESGAMNSPPSTTAASMDATLFAFNESVERLFIADETSEIDSVAESFSNHVQLRRRAEAASVDLLWHGVHESFRDFLVVSFRDRTGAVLVEFSRILPTDRFGIEQFVLDLSDLLFRELNVTLGNLQHFEQQVGNSARNAHQLVVLARARDVATASVASLADSPEEKQERVSLKDGVERTDEAVQNIKQLGILSRRSPLHSQAEPAFHDLLVALRALAEAAIEYRDDDSALTIVQRAEALATTVTFNHESVLNEVKRTRDEIVKAARENQRNELRARIEERNNELQEKTSAAPSTFSLIKGTFHALGYSPDGDTLRFKANSPAHWEKLAGPTARRNAREPVSIRYEGIDTLETHYRTSSSGPMHQPLDLANDATDFNLEQAGIAVRVWRAKRSRVLEADDRTRGYVVARTTDAYGRPVAFVFAGGTNIADGAPVFLTLELLRESINYKLIEAGLAYPTYYSDLFVELRNELTRAVKCARCRGLKIWSRDKTGGVSVTGIDELQRMVILPKLFRRLVECLALNDDSVSGFKGWLSNRAVRVFVVSAGLETNFAEVVSENGSTIGLIVKPEDLVFSLD